MEIRPVKADLEQVIAGQSGEFIQIENDVQNVANDLHEIDHHIRLRYSKAGGYFVIYWKPDHEEEGSGELITTAQELDKRIVTEVRRIYQMNTQPGFNFADELERVEDEAKREQDRKFFEDNAEMYERMAHALRKDLNLDKRKVFVPEGIPDEGG